MCVPGCSYSNVRLEMFLFGVSHEILHEGLIGVEAPDVAPPTIKLVPQLRWFECSECRESFIYAGLGTTVPGSLMMATSSIDSIVRYHVDHCPCWFPGPRSVRTVSGRPRYARCRYVLHGDAKRGALGRALLLQISGSIVGVVPSFVWPLELVGTESPLDVVGTESSLELVGTESLLEVVGTESSLELVGTESPLKLVMIESPLELVGTESPLVLVGIENPLELLVRSEISLELVEIESPLELIEIESPLKLAETETPLELVETKNSLKLVRTESSLELVEHYCSGSELVEHCRLGSRLAEHYCSIFGLAEHYCLGSRLVEHYCSSYGLSSTIA
ncbi:hypothetical protein B296_00013714 [Ensete ventricosum]|uniref:Uncharacterized protein n=1 Tax=Ensete ventricosum TaxID=4639 RepID=A0A427AQ59_ENSVE|nr:hypothetical protein B296_00013714 [Ensete ventricosum]